MGKTLWGPTIWILILRGSLSAIVFLAIDALLVGKEFLYSAAVNPFGQRNLLWLVPNVLIGGPGAHLLIYAIMRIFRFTSPYFRFACSIADPIIYTLQKIAPGLVPVENFKFFNFVVLIVVRERP